MAFIENLFIKKTYHILFMRKNNDINFTEETSSRDLLKKMLSKFNVNLT